jgi:hypothetical protein
MGVDGRGHTKETIWYGHVKKWRKSGYLSSYWNGMQKDEDAGET